MQKLDDGGGDCYTEVAPATSSWPPPTTRPRWRRTSPAGRASQTRPRPSRPTPLSASQGGKLLDQNGNCFTKDDYDTQFDQNFVAAVYSATPGKPTQPVQTQFGFHVILVDHIGKAPIASVRGTIASDIASDELTKLYDAAKITIDPRFGTWNRYWLLCRPVHARPARADHDAVHGRGPPLAQRHDGDHGDSGGDGDHDGSGRRHDHHRMSAGRVVVVGLARVQPVTVATCASPSSASPTATSAPAGIPRPISSPTPSPSTSATRPPSTSTTCTPASWPRPARGRRSRTRRGPLRRAGLAPRGRAHRRAAAGARRRRGRGAPALSYLDLAWSALGVDPLAAVGVRLVDGRRFATEAAAERGPRRGPATRQRSSPP